MTRKTTKQPKSAKVASKPGDVFTLKVALDGQKSCWRRIAIRGEQTLDDLHEAIYDAFDRYDEHLYSFYFPRPGTKGRARLRDAAEFICPYSFEDPGSLADETVGNAAETTLASLRLTPQQEFLYLFDFGDEWWHEITVEATDGVAGKGTYPRVLESRGKSPPQYEGDEEE
jgi:hypothetical protein